MQQPLQEARSTPYDRRRRPENLRFVVIGGGGGSGGGGDRVDRPASLGLGRGHRDPELPFDRAVDEAADCVAPLVRGGAGVAGVEWSTASAAAEW